MSDDVAVPGPDVREIRYGVIGTGMMGCEHIHNVRSLPGATVVAAADPHQRSLDDAVAAAGAPIGTFTDHREMLDRVELDAVVVATPNHTHRDVLHDVWAHPDVAVMIEKPLCTTVADCLGVRDAASRHTGVVWMGLEYRYMPPVQRFLSEVAAGAAGDVRTVFVREHRFPFLQKVGNWNRFTANTGGTLVEKCCHFFDLMNLVMPGRPRRVFASGGQDVNHLDEVYDGRPADILDNAFVVVDYDEGRRALLDLCMFAEGSRWEQEIVAVGDAGKVEVHVPGFMEVARGSVGEVVVGSRGPDWPVRTEQVDADDRILYQGGHHGASFLEHLRFCEAIRTGATPDVTLDEGLWSVAVGAAAHQSIEEGRPVSLDEVGLA